jgi:hypothetical protein
MVIDKNIEFNVRPPKIVQTTAHYLEKEPGYYLEMEWELLKVITRDRKKLITLTH